MSSKDIERTKQLSKDQSMLALSLLTDLLNDKRPALTFVINSDGELVELGSRKVLMENKPVKRLNDYLG